MVPTTASPRAFGNGAAASKLVDLFEIPKIVGKTRTVYRTNQHTKDWHLNEPKHTPSYNALKDILAGLDPEKHHALVKVKRMLS